MKREPPSHAEVMLRVELEQERQIAKWGKQDHDAYFWYAILGEEFGEIGKALNERDFEHASEELIQVAAVCLSWLEAGMHE